MTDSLFNLAWMAMGDPALEVRVTDNGLTAPRRGTILTMSEGPGADLMVQWDLGLYVTTIPAAKFTDARYAVSTRKVRPATPPQEWIDRQVAAAPPGLARRALDATAREIAKDLTDAVERGEEL